MEEGSEEEMILDFSQEVIHELYLFHKTVNLGKGLTTTHLQKFRNSENPIIVLESTTGKYFACEFTLASGTLLNGQGEAIVFNITPQDFLNLFSTCIHRSHYPISSLIKIEDIQLFNSKWKSSKYMLYPRFSQPYCQQLVYLLTGVDLLAQQENEMSSLLKQFSL